MTRDPVRRRFGRGAARLRIGLPRGAERLSQLARRAIRLERRLTIVPFTTAALILWLLATSPPLVRDDAPTPSTTQLVFELEPTPRVQADDAQAIPRPRTRLKTRDPEPSPKLAGRSASGDRRSEPANASPERPDSTARRPNEPRLADRPLSGRVPSSLQDAALATKGARWSEPDVLREDSALRAEPDAESALRALAPDTTRQADRTFASALVRGTARSGADRAVDAHPIAGPRTVAAPSTARPVGPASERDAGRDGRDRELAAVNARDAGERRSFLATLARGDDDARSAADATPRRPRVSAARPGPSLDSAGTGRGRPGGWEEVPLDALPDCSPPGRQDLLKKRILLAVPGGRECSNQAGSFRFVETRTLGAFLMWSRPNPDARAGQPRDRDACDVLERALACLGETAMQESKSR